MKGLQRNPQKQHEQDNKDDFRDHLLELSYLLDVEPARQRRLIRDESRTNEEDLDAECEIDEHDANKKEIERLDHEDDHCFRRRQLRKDRFLLFQSYQKSIVGFGDLKEKYQHGAGEGSPHADQCKEPRPEQNQPLDIDPFDWISPFRQQAAPNSHWPNMGFRSNHPGATCIVRPARGSRGGASSSAFIADPRDNFTMEVSFYHNPGASAACIETGGGPRLFDNCGRARIFCAVIPGVPRSGKIPNP